MVKSTKKVKAVKPVSAIKEAKLEIKNLKAELKALKVSHKKELHDAVVATYDSAVHAAFDEFERRETARDAVIEKAVSQALADFEKGLDKKAKKANKSTKPAKKAGKKIATKKKA